MYSLKFIYIYKLYINMYIYIFCQNERSAVRQYETCSPISCSTVRACAIVIQADARFLDVERWKERALRVSYQRLIARDQFIYQRKSARYIRELLPPGARIRSRGNVSFVRVHDCRSSANGFRFVNVFVFALVFFFVFFAFLT